MERYQVQSYIDKVWQESIVSQLIEYIKIPNKSPLFDANWQQNGYMDQAVNLISQWAEAHLPHNAKLEVIRLEGRTPLLLIDVPGQVDDTIVMYGHLDKQPEMTGWEDGLGPWQPVLRDGKLYGRGGADDGYAAFASLTAINALQQQGIKHARCVVLIEASEESGSPDLPYYIEALKDTIGTPSLVICLDSGAGNYDQLWMTTSLRGNIVGELSVETISEGVHSGNASGIVPDSFRIIRRLLDRLEDVDTGKVHLRSLIPQIPAQRIEQAQQCAKVLGDEIIQAFPFHPGAKPPSDDLVELVLNRTWRAALTVTGADGLPALSDAGNVLRPITSLKLSMRTPPVCDIDKACQEIESVLLAEPPHGAKVTYVSEDGAQGWHAPIVSPWLAKACDSASETYYGKEAVYMGEGGTIPFMGMLGEKFPEAQFMITGVLGPKSNAHGPNEFLHIDMAKKLTACVSHVIAEHAMKSDV
jgi:acetylornithine deacetylase/succinyl-diaminopimelate desuccinylase-like protein